MEKHPCKAIPVLGRLHDLGVEVDGMRLKGMVEEKLFPRQPGRHLSAGSFRGAMLDLERRGILVGGRLPRQRVPQGGGGPAGPAPANSACSGGTTPGVGGPGGSGGNAS